MQQRPAKDIYHDTVKNALIKDGWTITDDPLRLRWGNYILYVDLGAERLLRAIKNDQKIAVEVKSFASSSNMADLENALVLRQHIIVGRDSEIAPTDRPLMVGGNSDSRLLSRPIN
ncbi:fatty-acid synthase [Candidatus Poribacteria bacterium]|nr:MAG: fatty-acid synthase [Candidatus Poribacteria bacterium]